MDGTKFAPIVEIHGGRSKRPDTKKPLIIVLSVLLAMAGFKFGRTLQNEEFCRMRGIGMMACSDDEESPDVEQRFRVDSMSIMRASRLAVDASNWEADRPPQWDLWHAADAVAPTYGLDLFDFDNAEGPPSKKRAKLAMAETKDSLKVRSIAGWLPIINTNPESSNAGRRLLKSSGSESEMLDIIACYLMDKSGNTSIQRLGPVSLLWRWSSDGDKGWPPTEETIIAYAAEMMGYTSKSTLSRLLEAVKFMGGTFQFGRSVVAAAESRFLAGKALKKVLEMPKIAKTKALELQFLCKLEHLVVHGELTVEVKMVMGGILILAYFRARINDADVIIKFIFYASRISMEVRDTKTSLSRHVVILMAPTATLSGILWLDYFYLWRENQNAPLGDHWPLFPSRKNGVWEKTQARTGDVNALFWAAQVIASPMSVPKVKKTSHSAKHSFLDAAAVWGMDRQSRQTLGYHKDSRNKATDTYTPNMLIAPVAKLNEMILQFQSGKFDPDGERAPTLRKPKQSAASSKDGGCRLSRVGPESRSGPASVLNGGTEDEAQAAEAAAIDSDKEVVVELEDAIGMLRDAAISDADDGDATPKLAISPVKAEIRVGDFDNFDDLQKASQEDALDSGLGESSDTSSSNSSSDEDQDIHTDACETTQDVVDQEIAQSCAKQVPLADTYFVNLNNGRIHRGRSDKSGLTGCGNPTGGNIIRLASGTDTDSVAPELICSNCFGKCLQIRASISRRLSEPDEPLSEYLKFD